MRDMMSDLDAKVALAPVVVTDDTAQTGLTIDLLGYSSATFVLALGTLADAAATFAVKLQDGDASNMSDAADVAAGDLIGTTTLASFDQAADGKCRKIGYRGLKRYVRVVVTPSGNAAAAPMSAVAVLSPLRAPASNPPV